MINYYTVSQIIEFMDVEIDMDSDILVNNKPAELDTLVYENFSIEWKVLAYRTHPSDVEHQNMSKEELREQRIQKILEKKQIREEKAKEAEEEKQQLSETDQPEEKAAEEEEAKEPEVQDLTVIVNNLPVTMKGKSSYVFVDVFEYIDFDLHSGNGRAVVTRLNGEFPSYMAILKEGDKIDVYWEE